MGSGRFDIYKLIGSNGMERDSEKWRESVDSLKYDYGLKEEE